MKEIKLTRGKVAIVDDDDFEYLSQFKWHTNKMHDNLFSDNKYYAAHTFIMDGKKKSVYMHRLITKAPKGKVVDHINHDGLDNRKENLRIGTHQENANNRLPREAQAYLRENVFGVLKLRKINK